MRTLAAIGLIAAMASPVLAEPYDDDDDASTSTPASSAIVWHEGGRLGRRDLSLGFGAQATFRVGHDKPHFIGVYYAMKAFVAKSPPGKDRPPMCAGPCDEPTGPSPWDFGILFNFGVPFGR